MTVRGTTLERSVVISINALQSLITSATKYVMNQIALLKIEESCWISLLAKNRMYDPKM